MKKILGLDLGTTSIGWALVHEAESENEQSEIIRLGVRVNPLSTDEQQDFEKGKSITINADRTLKRGARRNLQRYKLRRSNLIDLLSDAHLISENSALTEDGKNTTFQTLALRAKAAKQPIEKEELARVLLTINKKRGYKSSRKANTEDEGQAIDGMAVAINLYENDFTPGQYCFNLLKSGKKVLPDFYRSDLELEFNKVWRFQKQYHAEILDDELFKALEGQGQQNTRKRFLAIKQVYTADIKGNRDEKKLKAYELRARAINEKLTVEEVAYVLTEINNNLNSSSGYLGAISDRSKELYFEKQTVGEYLYKQIIDDRHTRLKGQVFYRQDYLDEFEQIWETQKNHHSELTEPLKKEIRDIVIFYQRRLKSQKGLISFCEFESKKVTIDIDGKPKLKIIGPRVCPKSSPLFQEFKIWQNLSNLEFLNKKTKETVQFVGLEIEEKINLFNELNLRGTKKKKEVLKLLNLDTKEWDLNFTELQGNVTNGILFEAFQKILGHSGHDIDLTKLNAEEAKEAIKSVFDTLGIDSEILNFNAELSNGAFERQKSYLFWHLLYSYEGDNSNTGNNKLYQKLNKTFGFEKEYAQYLVNITFPDDYGSLSAKAIRKIIPFIKENRYSEACSFAGYNHSHSITAEENEKRELKNRLELLPKNSLRNPVVEKILNQMVNVINTIIDEPSLGKPDEIRIELARELKKSAKEREAATRDINAAKTKHDEFRKILQKEFFIPNPTRNDIIRYKLYKELASRGYHTLYSNTYIAPDKLFSKEFDIEHIIPKARLFDDSFSNKTLEVRDVNIKKSNDTAYDFIESNFSEKDLLEYIARVESFYKDGKDAFDKPISKAKYKKLLMKGAEIGEGFIERDLRESQYIAKKAKQMLLEVCKTVVSTSGSITDKLRQDWGLINTMKELNLPKYRELGLTVFEERKDDQKIEKIVDWTKRNDHRHHAMDALTVAFTKHNHIQYLNNLNARDDKNGKKKPNIYVIEQKETYRDDNGKRLFKQPMPNFRIEAKRKLEEVLISHKAKNKVVTQNKNKVKGSNKTQTTLTPRGQLHKETIYGQSKKYSPKWVKIGVSFDEVLAKQVANKNYKAAILKRLAENENNPKKAFGGKNSPAKNPIITEENIQVPEKVKLVWLENTYTIRKDISPDLKLEKVVDSGIQKILQKRLDDFDGKAKEAFVNLDKNPIWLNKEKGISIKRVTITGVNNAEPLHNKKDHFGYDILNAEGKRQASDYVSTGNNHHVAIYRDDNGNLQEEVVSLFEAVARVNAGLPIINREHEKGWEFLFTMKQNEMFVFPSDDFEPNELDLTNPDNYALISPNLFRVQKIGSLLSGFWFRHHLETNVEVKKELKNNTYKVIQSTKNLESILKVRINHIGQIVQVGEY